MPSNLLERMRTRALGEPSAAARAWSDLEVDLPVGVKVEPTAIGCGYVMDLPPAARVSTRGECDKVWVSTLEWPGVVIRAGEGDGVPGTIADCVCPLPPEDASVFEVGRHRASIACLSPLYGSFVGLDGTRLQASCPTGGECMPYLFTLRHPK